MSATWREPAIRKTDPARVPRASLDSLLLGALYAAEGALLVLLICLNKRGDTPAIEFFQSRPGLVAVCAALLLSISVTWVVARARQRRHPYDRSFALTAAMNLVTVVVAVTAGETMLRLAAHRLLEGTLVVNDSVLLPRHWQQLARNYRQAMHDQRDSYVFRYDERMGWTWRPNLHDENGIWTTSAEGLRSGQPGVVYRDRSPRRRIAVLGDSFTFGEDVRFDDSWVHLLETELGRDTQVLNFGVSTYGIDQILWKYESEVASWKADIVMFGVFPADVRRALAVYPLIGRPRWSMPYSKPRLVTSRHGFDIVNLPPLTPAELFAAQSIDALPHLSYDWGYYVRDWDFRWYHHSALLRFLLTKFPHWRPPDSGAQHEALLIAGEIFRRFAKSVRANGSKPMFVYLPSERDAKALASGEAFTSEAMQALQNNGQSFVDLTPCIAALPENERFMLGGVGHYTPRSNAAVARCLAEHLGN